MTCLQGHRHTCNAEPQNLAEWLVAPKKWLAGIAWAWSVFRSDSTREKPNLPRR